MAERPHPGYWQDWLLLVLGAWLFISPWMLNFAAVGAAAWNAWVVGAALVVLAAVLVARFRRRLEGIAIVLGLWLVISHYVIGVQAVPWAVYWNTVIVGLATVGLATWNLVAHWPRRLFR